ncbi:hypothetical protein GGI20_000143 [Coemansia sp. BCRC 34301]|nr:hypothetical protein GGI20_000143 [Coemansia sp. BCRC 34301]
MSWTSEELDFVDVNSEIIAKLGDVDFGGGPMLSDSGYAEYVDARVFAAHTWLVDGSYESVSAGPAPKKRRIEASGSTSNTSMPTAAAKRKGKATGTDPLYEELEQLLASTAALLPFQEYVARDGQLNMIDRLPTQYTRSDFEPEVQLLYGTRGVSSYENLRCKATDFVHFMAYTSTEDSGAAAIIKADGYNEGVGQEHARRQDPRPATQKQDHRSC